MVLFPDVILTVGVALFHRLSGFCGMKADKKEVIDVRRNLDVYAVGEKWISGIEHGLREPQARRDLSLVILPQQECVLRPIHCLEQAAAAVTTRGVRILWGRLMYTLRRHAS